MPIFQGLFTRSLGQTAQNIYAQIQAQQGQSGNTTTAVNASGSGTGSTGDGGSSWSDILSNLLN